MAFRLGVEVANRVHIRDVDAARVGLRAVGTVLLRVHHEERNLVALDSLQRHDGARAEGELGGVRFAGTPLALHHGILSVADAVVRGDHSHRHGLALHPSSGEVRSHCYLEGQSGGVLGSGSRLWSQLEDTKEYGLHRKRAAFPPQGSLQKGEETLVEPRAA